MLDSWRKNLVKLVNWKICKKIKCNTERQRNGKHMQGLKTWGMECTILTWLIILPQKI